jgi:coenzyme F420-reducing hydrogenase delta subunit/Pyruvate/2-oxoacid:ferredoxin oxidoreductase delta subunit
MGKLSRYARWGMRDSCVAAVRINQDLCSRCMVCHSLCPFEAIDRHAEDGRVEVDMQRCQVCGICYSACPVAAIQVAYYDYVGLLDHVRAARAGSGASALVLTCRGSSLSENEIDAVLAARGIRGSHLTLRVPCAGRIPADFIFNAITDGVERVVSIQCEDGSCRMKDGTAIGTRRLLLERAVLGQLGYPEDVLSVVKFSRKAIWQGDDCVGCGKCYFICPFGAIEAEPFSSPKVIEDKCVGCGACQMVCPHKAIQVQGFEYDQAFERYARAAGRDGRSPKVLILSCQWSEYSALDHPEELREVGAMVLEVPCVKGLDPMHVVNALDSGFDGVMAIYCSESDCKLPVGRDAADRQLDVLRNCLKGMGVADRFETHEHSPRCKGDFVEKLNGFRRKIEARRSTAMEGER